METNFRGWSAKILSATLLAVVMILQSASVVWADNCDTKVGECPAGRDRQNCLISYLTCKGTDANEFLMQQAEKFIGLYSSGTVLGPNNLRCVEAEIHCNIFCDTLSARDMQSACNERCAFLRKGFCSQ